MLKVRQQIDVLLLYATRKENQRYVKRVLGRSLVLSGRHPERRFYVKRVRRNFLKREQRKTVSMIRMMRSTVTFSLVRTDGLVGLALLSLLLASCADSRSYPGAVHGLTFNGTIRSVDLQNHHLTLMPLKPGEPVVFLWERSTKFWQGGVPIDPESLERTWLVRVHYHISSGQHVAHHVYVQTPYPIVH